jgi:hypothetical protein
MLGYAFQARRHGCDQLGNGCHHFGPVALFIGVEPGALVVVRQLGKKFKKAALETFEILAHSLFP